MFTRASSILRRFSALLLIALLLTGVGAASAQTVISSVPYTISSSGKYILGGNLSVATANQNAIRIMAPNVTLDLDGNYVSCAAPNTASTLAIIFVGDYANVTIRNGLVSGNGYGISFGGSTNARNYIVENVTVSRIWQHGVNFASNAPGSQVRNNSFSLIGGSTAGTNAQSEAIIVRGGVRVENNSIASVTGTGTGVGYGIYGTPTDFILNNTISSADTGIFGGKYAGNLTAGCTTPFAGGINAGGNN